MFISLKQFQSCHIDRIKSESHCNIYSYRYEHSKILRYISEYKKEIKKIKELLNKDPNNIKLQIKLKDKEYRKQQFEEDIKVIHFDIYGNRIN